MKYDVELVGKIGSMALIREEERDIDYNVFSRIGSELCPGMIWAVRERWRWAAGLYQAHRA